ncbi:MAG: transcription initiation factor IIB family protein [Candidatus Nanohaloarchaea archaeon]
MTELEEPIAENENDVVPESESGDDTIPVKAEMKEEEASSECPSCGTSKFVRDSSNGELYCKNCGTIVDESKIDLSQEWRAFNSEEKEKKSRSGSPITFTKSDRGMGTKIGKSGELNKVSSSKRGKYYRMKKWDRRRENSKSRALETALSELKRLVSQLDLPESVFEEAARLTEKAREEEIIKGRGIEPTVAALAYLVSRKQQVPRTLDEVSTASSIDKRKLGKTYRYVARELDMSIDPAKPEHFIPRYGEKLGFNGEAQAEARQIIKDARNNGVLAGRSPKSVVAGVFYIVSALRDRDMTQTEIADVIGVTEVTVRKNYREIADELEIELQN